MSNGNITTREGLILQVAHYLALASGKDFPTIPVKDGRVSRAEIEDWFNSARLIVDGKSGGPNYPNPNR
ncbi:hypothetical protein KOEU_17530 [Komagataeibacter europaeus]|uniref:Uncharacterized protein n=1 Tax=Komagataeibacter europaeus TaxID=33995 RepID=A0A0M0EHP5_KOMEU|nr:hypothetical protein KOEU_17530 [Komagataeibacter europaeus]